LKKLLVAALLASAIAVPAFANELVVNGGFESPYGLNYGWNYTVSPGLSVVVQPSAAHSGDAWARFNGEWEDYPDDLWQELDTVVGQTYTYSLWLAGAGDDQFPSSLQGTLGAQNILDAWYSSTFDYVQFTGTYVATSAVTDLHFTGFNSLGLYLLDDVSVTGPPPVECETRIACGGGGGGEGGVPEPESWALMVLGFAGLGAMLRRRPRLQTA